MPAERNTRGVSATGSVRNTRSRRDSCASNASIPDTGSRPMSPFRPTSPFGYSPYGNMAPLTPGNSRPGTPSNKRNGAQNTRKVNSSTHSFTSLLAPPPSPPLSADVSESNSMDMDPPTITWECANALVENQKVQNFFEKPVYSKTGQIISHGKMVTKTVTMTITTTIASTEILRPGEEGYEASMEKYRQQQIEQHQKHIDPKTNAEDSKFDKTFVEAFSPEDTMIEQRRHIFHQNVQNARLQEQLRLAKYNSPSPSPPPVRPTRQE
ncbi:hypothetical protein TWF173_008165 [Orbilia oligospora]|uniref:Uncharacterized protein n=2 Tax=Orbilia oligospora TaxID=2813651 RepID=G1XU42_ARTOA|nr:hypothetical protein AOL_s00215g321 [Orbilia oligospora ATCC 24927]EGX43585.1 hypothetical protein AOL_s00215g321 [Orbilia oligospora ATCC 24927]KAF3275438.1 hypothetical protein TWF970_006886 [Orbilia oligospora]KAF3311720.1 hypothetical protein TWF173_008165 [Orbilia oligospora]